MTQNGYFRAEACKNTFVLFDKSKESTLDDAFLKWSHGRLIAEKRDDALILLDGKAIDDTFYVKMLVWGADEQFGEFCGNGSRACAAYLFEHYPQYKKFYLITKFGEHELTNYGEGIYSVRLPHAILDVNNTNLVNKPELFTKEGDFYCLNFEGKKLFFLQPIEPHLVIGEDLSDEELFNLAKKLNDRRDIFPLGINANAYYMDNNNIFHVKTYERGVQRLTKSCGTGSLSSSTHYLNRKSGKVDVVTPGGRLEISLDDIGLKLKGPAFVEDFVES